MAAPKKNDPRADLDELLHESIAAQATEKVWERFAVAMIRLDEPSRELLTRYFDGATVRELSLESQIEEHEMRSWLASKKRELIQLIKKDISVKQ